MELQLYNRQRSLKMCDKWLKEGQKWMEMAWCLFCNIIAIDGGGWCVCVSLSPWCGATARPGPAPSRALLKTKILKTTGLFSCKQLSDVIFTDKNNFPEIIAENTELMVQNKIGEVACLYGSLSTVQCDNGSVMVVMKDTPYTLLPDLSRPLILGTVAVARLLDRITSPQLVTGRQLVAAVALSFGLILVALAFAC